MKMSFLVLVTLVMSALPALANNGLNCRSVDRGSEEHRGGHRSCDECLREHGRCIERCSIEFVTCEAVGRDYQGQSITLRGSGYSRYEAERAALNYCERNFSNCSTYRCSDKAEEISSRECVRPAPPTPPPAPPTPPTPPPTPNPPTPPGGNKPPDNPRPGNPGNGGPGRPENPRPGNPGNGGPGNGGPGRPENPRPGNPGNGGPGNGGPGRPENPRPGNPGGGGPGNGGGGNPRGPRGPQPTAQQSAFHFEVRGAQNA